MSTESEQQEHRHRPSGQGHAGRDAEHHGHLEHEGHGDHSGQAEHSGHSGHSGHGDHAAQFRRLFLIMLVVAVPTTALDPAFAELLGYSVPETLWIRGVAPVLGTVMFFWGGRPFLAGGLSELRASRPGMMLLIALALTVALLSSWGATLGLIDAGLTFWWELALLVVIMLLGHWMEMRSIARTSSALDSLAALMPDEAERVDGESVTTVSPEELAAGDVVVVRPGASVPADGRIVSGTASMDESMITGESQTVPRGEGEQVVAGTVAADSGLRVEITAVGEETALAGIRRLVEQAQNSSSRAQRLADVAAAWLFWLALAAAALTAVAWLLVGSPDDAVVRTITVLVIACPHALGLAVPLVVSIASERAAGAGVLISDRVAMETMRGVDTVLFDKTGTLTRGEPELVDVAAAAGQESEQVLALAAAAESDSEHPLAAAIREAAEHRGLDVPAAEGFSSSPAVGVEATVDGTRVQVGGPRLLAEHGLDELAAVEPWRAEGAIILHIVVDGAVAGALRLDDAIREESRQAVDALHARGMEVAMITGDAEAVARTVADQLGIDRAIAGVRPEDKAAEVARLQQEGRRTAMVGDGVNDAPALAQADVGIAIGAGTDVAVGSAGLILASSDPRGVLSALRLSDAARGKMLQNLWWAAGYNLIAVPLAAGALAPIGFVLPMSVGAVLMSLSTLLVAANAQLLRRLDLRPEAMETA